MAAAPTNLQMIGMIPMPEADYNAATRSSLDALKRAMTPQGINPEGLRPPPTRMMPVGQAADGKMYALVDTCNSNNRPTVVPLSRFYPPDASKPNEPPKEFIPMGALASAPPPPPDAGSAGAQAAGITGGATVPQAGSLGPVKAAAESGAPLAGTPKPGVAQAIQAAQPVASLGATASGADAQVVSQGGQLLQAAQTGASGGRAGAATQALPAATGLAQASPASAPASASPLLDTAQSERLVRAMQQMQAARESRSRSLLELAAASSSGRPDTTGGLGTTVLGVIATQDPAQSQAMFQQLGADKAAGLQPTSGIYQRLQTALATIGQNPVGS